MPKQVLTTAGILLAMAVAITAGATPEVFEYLVAPAGPGNQRNCKADMLQLKGGRLLLPWIDLHGRPQRLVSGQFPVGA